MKSWEVVREIENQCANNQMRDVFFDEVETDDPAEWVRSEVKGRQVEIRVDKTGEGRVAVFAESGGVSQKFLFTEL